MKTFASVAELTAQTLKAGEKVRLDRYYADGDLVEGLVYEIQSSGSADGYIDHATVNGVAKLIHGSTVTAEQAGCSTSSTDNSDNINAALLLANVTGTGEYQVQKTIEVPSNRKLFDIKLFTDGDTFTSSVSPVAFVVNKTFDRLDNADENVYVEDCTIRISNNTVAFNSKGIMFGGVKNGYIRNNKVIINGTKHTAAIECYKSTENVWIENNSVEITTGNVTGGGIWVANRTTNETTKNIYINNNTVTQDSIDEILAVFPVAGPVESIYINNNRFERLDQGATTGPIARLFVGDGLTGGQLTASLQDCFFTNNLCIDNRSTNTTSGAVKVGNAGTDTIDPERVTLDNNVIRGVFTSSAIGLRISLNSASDDVRALNTTVENTAAAATTVGISAPQEGVIIKGGSVKGFQTGVDSFYCEDVVIEGGSIGILQRGDAFRNTCKNQAVVNLRIRARGAGVRQRVQGNRLIANASTRCMQVDTATGAASAEYISITDNLFDGSAGSVAAIERTGSQTVSNTQVVGNDFSTCATLWSNNLGVYLGKNSFNSSVTNPVGNISANAGSEFWNYSGGAGATLYVKESGTSNTGWVAK